MSKVKSFLFFLILTFFLFISGCIVPQTKYVQTLNDPNLYAGDGEICQNNLIKIKCGKGLGRYVVREDPFVIAICLPLEYINMDNSSEEYKYSYQKYKYIIESASTIEDD